MNKVYDWLDSVVQEDLPRNKHPMKFSSYKSLLFLFIPGVIFLLSLGWLTTSHHRFFWLSDIQQYPWQFWGIAVSGLVALAGGVGDWLFHKVYVCVGPKEHESHELALIVGVSVFILMAIASVIPNPLLLLVPIVMALIVTTVLICYDEFAFHIKRCKDFENRLHRMLVFGNAAAFFFWFHWLFVTLS